MNRPIDQALAEDRPAKSTIRNKWLLEVQKYPSTNGVPLYLTLPGAEGKDIQLLIDAGVIEVTDTGAIKASDQFKVIAVEANSEAVLALQRRFPGLRIRESRLEDMINGESPYSWPSRENRTDFTARVINVDSDKSLRAVVRDGVTSFPLISIIKKISQLHYQPQTGAAQPWSLCVTVNSTVNWPAEAIDYFLNFLGENCRQHAQFRGDVAAALGETFVKSLEAVPCGITVTNLEAELLRKVVCIFLPKMIISMINDHHWGVESCLTLSYGGEEGHAPMATMILALRPDAGTPSQRYEANLNSIVAGLGHIGVDGEIEMVA